MLHTMESLSAACLAHNLSTEGGYDELHARLGAHLVAKFLAPKRRADATISRPPKRSKAEWCAFMKTEREKVLASGFTGRTDILKEIARRWKIFKTVGTSTAPLALPEPFHDGLIEALQDLDGAELDQAIEAHGLDKEVDTETKVRALAEAMLA